MSSAGENLGKEKKGKMLRKKERGKKKGKINA
jgi:hypothetical protein